MTTSPGATPAATPASGAPSPYLAGEVIADRYRLDREIGRGGMGVVWEAHSLVLDVDVALKLIHAETAGPSLATRMAREAHAAARLGHPALVRVFDFGWTNRGDPFLVMELVQGETLASKVRRDGPLAAIKAVQTLLPIADGLRLAHERSIVHRDIKPDNILLATDAFGRVQPKLLDFGIAKVDQAPVNGKLTQVGAVLGSPEYMSPEQAQGLEAVDARTDVWSLSVSLYELLTGDVPFVGSNYNALMQTIIHDDVSPPSAGDPELWAVLSKGLAKSPDQRWASMSEFGEALASWLYNHGVKEDLSGNSVRAVWLDRPSATGDWNRVSETVPRATRTTTTTRSRPATVGGWQRSGIRWGVGVAAVALLVFVALEVTVGADRKPGSQTVGKAAEALHQSEQPRPMAAPPDLKPPPAALAQPVEAQPVEARPAPITHEPPTPVSTPGETTNKRNTRIVPKPKKPRHDFGF